MAFGFIASNATHNSASTGATVTKPAGTSNNDVMFALIKRGAGSEADPTTVPTGWEQLAKRVGDANNTYWLYWKLAASEGADYTWTWAGSTRTGVLHATYRDGFDTANVVDVVSNTAYVTSDAICRAAGMTVSAVNSPVIFFGNRSGSGTHSFTPPTNPGTFVEDAEVVSDAASRWACEVASMVWGGSGATGNIDATLDGISTDKHAFAVALNPGGGAPSTGRVAYMVGQGGRL